MTDVEQLYTRYFGIIREKCARMLQDPHEAQDVAQETLLKLWRSPPREQHPLQVTAWIYRTSTRLAANRLRERRRNADGPAPEPSHDSNLDQRLHVQGMLARVAGRVPQQELEAAILHRLDGLGQEELALTLGVSDRTVRRWLEKFDARVEQLREEL